MGLNQHTQTTVLQAMAHEVIFIVKKKKKKKTQQAQNGVTCAKPQITKLRLNI